MPVATKVQRHFSYHISTTTTAALILSLIYVVVFVFSSLVRLRPPQLELVYALSEQNDARITWMIPSGVLWQQGIRPGDRIVALDGRTPAAEGAGPWVGQSVSVQTRAGETIFVDAGILRSSQITWILLLLSPWFFLLGLLIYVRAQDRSIAFTAEALFANAAFALALAPAAIEDHVLAIGLEFVAVTLFAPCFLLFFLVFPMKRGSRRLREAIFIPPIIVSMLGLISLEFPPLYSFAAQLRLILLLGYTLVGVFLILHSLFTQQSAHSGLLIIALGTVASILPFIALYVIPTLLSAYPIIEAEYAIVPLVFLPISFAYAILRHNVLNITLIQRWLMDGLIWIGLVIIYTYAIFALGAGLLPILLATPISIIVFVVVLVMFTGTTFQWFYHRICRLIDKMLFKDSYDYRKVLQNLSMDLSTARDMDTLGVGLLHTIRRLINVEFVALVLKNRKLQKNFYVHTVVGTSRPELEDILTKLEWEIQEDPRVASLPIDQSILSIPLRVHNLIIGYICVGQKANGEPFRIEDRDLLSTLSVQIAAIIRNTQLVADLRQQVNTLDALYEQLQHAQEEERTRLAADIHDEPLQTALHLHRQLVAGMNSIPSAGTLIPLSQALIDQLRTVCTTMRPFALDDLGLIAALDALAQEQSDRLEVPILLDVETSVNDPIFNPTIELVLYRATQEAINNCFRHAHADTIRITLRQREDLIQLSIADNGRGFVVPDDLTSLVIQGHLGLVGMHERVERIGGWLTVDSKPEQGTTIELTVPLREKGEFEAPPL